MTLLSYYSITARIQIWLTIRVTSNLLLLKFWLWIGIFSPTAIHKSPINSWNIRWKSLVYISMSYTSYVLALGWMKFELIKYYSLTFIYAKIFKNLLLINQLVQKKKEFGTISSYYVPKFSSLTSQKTFLNFWFGLMKPNAWAWFLLCDLFSIAFRPVTGLTVIFVINSLL